MSPRVAPGPTARSFFETYREFRADHLALFLRSVRAYGDVVRFALGPELIHLLVHPKDIHIVLRERVENYPKSRLNKRIHCAFGTGVLTAMGAAWRGQRRMIQPAFSKDRVDLFVEVVVGETTSMLDAWEPKIATGEPIDLAVEARLLNLRIVGRVMFGTDLVADALELDAAFEDILEVCTRRITAPLALPTWVPSGDHRRLRRAVGRIDDLVFRIISDRRARKETHPGEGDLLQMLLSAREPDTGRTMNDRQVRDEVITILLAGYDSPGTAMAWTWWELARHPDVGERLADEVRQVLDGRSPGRDDLAKLEYATMIYKEALRLASPAGNIGRQALENDEIAGYHIPAGSTIVINPFVTHRHAETWPDPDRFDPDRFTREAELERPLCAFIPFGEGPRKCVGTNLALMQGPLILATLWSRVRFIDLDGAIEHKPMMTYRPRRPVLARVVSAA